MELLKQAFDNLERNLERTVAEAASAVVESANEFPKPAAESARPSKQLHVSSAAAATQVKKAESSWVDFDWHGQQLQWQAALQQLQEADVEVSAEQLQQQLVSLYAQLLSLQDPVPAINAAAGLVIKTAELEAKCRSLQHDVYRLEQDQAEFSQLLANYNKEKAAHASLQATYQALQEKLSAATAATESAEEFAQTIQEQAATINALQASLNSLRAEYEASQATLFELTAAQEAAAGSVNAAELLAAEELERLNAQLLQVRKERALLQRQLQRFEEEQQQGAVDTDQPQQAAAAANGGGMSDQQQQERRGMPHHELELATLQAELQAAQEAARDQQHEVALMLTKLAAAESRMERLATELNRRPAASAVAAMAEQIAALSAVLGQQLEAEGWGQDAAAAAVAAAGVPGQLEPVLLERCKRLDQALQSAKADAATANQAAKAAEAQLQGMQQQLQQSEALVKQLEADVLAMSRASSNPGAAAATAADGSLTEQLQPVANISIHGSAVAGNNNSASGMELTSVGTLEIDLLRLVSASEGGAIDAAASATDDSSISSAAALLAAITGQRDRFKARITQLESDSAELTMRLQDCMSQNERVKQDNVALVEKLKFLQRYKQAAAGSVGGSTSHQSVTVIRVDGAGVIQASEAYADSSSSIAGSVSKAHRYSCGPISLDLGDNGNSSSRRGTLHNVPFTDVGGRGVRSRQSGKRQAGCFAGVLGQGQDDELDGGLDPEARYVKEYEAKLNPFAAFQASESEARLKSMQLHDKAMLAAGRLIAGSKVARAGLALYFVLLHMFLMILIYHSGMPCGAADQVVGGQGMDSITQARLAAAGSGVGGVAAAGSPPAGLRQLLELLR